MSFKLECLPERNLIFGGQNEEKDPRAGLNNFGPFRFTTETVSLDKIKLGLIGDKNSIEKAKELIKKLRDPIESKESNKWLYPSFPGMSKNSPFNCSLEYAESWQQTITLTESERVIHVKDVNQRIGSAVALYLNKIKNILEEDNSPDVILCCIPLSIEDQCGISENTRGAKTRKPSKWEQQMAEFKTKNQKFLSDWGVTAKIEEEIPPKGYDFRNSLKGRLMGLNNAKPIQLLRESTMDAILNSTEFNHNGRQEIASFAWNLSTAIFYKANGKPWRLAKLKDDTCYVGISFFRDKLNATTSNIQTSMAQIFTSSGEGLVLRGTDVYIDEELKEPHLSEKQAEELLKESIEKYTSLAGRNPVRVVIHKGTSFTEVEIKGFSKAIGDCKKDFVHISPRNLGIKFMRKGGYPVLRGTLITLTQIDHLIYTSGYIPRVRTYPGHRIPHPLLIRHIGDSEIKVIADEILGLTKLNWNTTSFSTYNPITLEFAQRVGDILSELEKGSVMQNHFRFFM